MSSATSPHDPYILQTLRQQVHADTQHWLERAVIGLNLCPFARAPHVRGLVHIAISGAQTAQQALVDLHEELQALRDCPASMRETTLLVFPAQFDDFYRFNDFLDEAEAVLQELNLEGDIQIASFHPYFQFADADVDDIANATNQSPYPTLHLIREASIDRAVDSGMDLDVIPERNIALLHDMGYAGWQDLGVQRQVSSRQWLDAQAAASDASVDATRDHVSHEMPQTSPTSHMRRAGSCPVHVEHAGGAMQAAQAHYSEPPCPAAMQTAAPQHAPGGQHSATGAA